MAEPRYMGGQAVIEGVMMRGPSSWAVAVRRPDGEIVLQVNPAPEPSKWVKVPLVRGVVALAESMSLGMRALTWSAQQAMDEEDGKELTRGQMAGALAVALLFFAGVFMALPAIVTKAAGSWFDSDVTFNAFEGAFRLTLFVGYVLAIGQMPNIRRVFQYHGAEHKAIAAYENGVELTPERAQQFTTMHVRCGTNFVLLVMVLAIASHTLFGRPDWAVLVASRVLAIPVVAALAYELIRLGARHVDRNRAVRVLMTPGLSLQKLTTREPSLDQLEVAIASLRAAMTAEQLAEVESRPPAVVPQPGFGLAPA